MDATHSELEQLSHLSQLGNQLSLSSHSKCAHSNSRRDWFHRRGAGIGLQTEHFKCVSGLRFRADSLSKGGAQSDQLHSYR